MRPESQLPLRCEPSAINLLASLIARVAQSAAREGVAAHAAKAAFWVSPTDSVPPGRPPRLGRYCGQEDMAVKLDDGSPIEQVSSATVIRWTDLLT